MHHGLHHWGGLYHSDWPPSAMEAEPEEAKSEEYAADAAAEETASDEAEHSARPVSRCCCRYYTLRYVASSIHRVPTPSISQAWGINHMDLIWVVEKCNWNNYLKRLIQTMWVK